MHKEGPKFLFWEKQSKPFSTVQESLQPSPLEEFPSSHSSARLIMKSPQLFTIISQALPEGLNPLEQLKQVVSSHSSQLGPRLQAWHDPEEDKR